MDKTTYYSTKLFLASVIPLMKEIAMRTNLKDKFFKNPGIAQISVITDEGKWGTHFLIENESITVGLNTVENPDVELEFKTPEHFVAFFKNKTKKLPKIKGFFKFGLLVATFKTLLKMAGVLGAKEAPKAEADKELLVRCMFYLLSNGISRLNKLEHPDIHDWAQKSPKRVYALAVDGYDDVAAYILVQAGKTKASKGLYKLSKPFFTLRFADLDSALAILLDTGDMLALTAEKKLIMEGAPEFGAKLGDFMMMVGEFVQ
ncbi:MAG: hypothetical protein CR988_02785 [Treponema sp.]|nr:MAG: hypothetical protein CR988_02785 [Treponema sp.]